MFMDQFGDELGGIQRLVGQLEQFLADLETSPPPLVILPYVAESFVKQLLIRM